MMLRLALSALLAILLLSSCDSKEEEKEAAGVPFRIPCGNGDVDGYYLFNNDVFRCSEGDTLLSSPIPPSLGRQARYYGDKLAMHSIGDRVYVQLMDNRFYLGVYEIDRAAQTARKVSPGQESAATLDFSSEYGLVISSFESTGRALIARTYQGRTGAETLLSEVTLPIPVLIFPLDSDYTDDWHSSAVSALIGGSQQFVVFVIDHRTNTHEIVPLHPGFMPNSVAFLPSGDLLLMDPYSGTILRYSAGQLSTYAELGPETDDTVLRTLTRLTDGRIATFKISGAGTQIVALRDDGGADPIVSLDFVVKAIMSNNGKLCGRTYNDRDIPGPVVTVDTLFSYPLNGQTATRLSAFRTSTEGVDLAGFGCL